MNRRHRTNGMAISDTLAHVLGPPQVGDYTEPLRPADGQMKEREAELQTKYRRIVSPDGEVRLEEVVDGSTDLP